MSNYELGSTVDKAISYYQRAREWMSPTLKTSAFLEKGVLTPEEFVAAGDELVFKCPTWSWATGDASQVKDYLPPDKQFLITRNVPCPKRVSELENSVSMGADNDGDDDDEWVLSNVMKKSMLLEDEFDILDEQGEVMEPKTAKTTPEEEKNNSSAGGGSGDGDDEYADMAEFEDDNVVVEDEAAAATTATTNEVDPDEDNLLRNVRTYDLSITYDKYHQTPRVWMMGYKHGASPLTGKEMLQDVMSDYANRVVTIESHPHVAGPHASIHPCKHGRVMKTIVQNLTKATGEEQQQQEEGTRAPSVDMYLFIFLKFVSSIIPTINYDFTFDVDASTDKS